MGYGYGAETAVAQTHASDGGRWGRLAEEQAASRRVAAAAAHGVEPSTLFRLVAEKVSRVLRVPLVSIVRIEDDDTATERASLLRGARVVRGRVAVDRSSARAS